MNLKRFLLDEATHLDPILKVIDKQLFPTLKLHIFYREAQVTCSQTTGSLVFQCLSLISHFSAETERQVINLV